MRWGDWYFIFYICTEETAMMFINDLDSKAQNDIFHKLCTK